MAWEGVRAGYELVSDDLLPIRFVDAAATTLSRGGPYPLGTVCFLARGHDAIAVERLTSSEAFSALVENGFGEHLDPQTWAFQFDAYHRLATSTPAVRLSTPEGRQHLAGALEALVDHLTSG